MALVENLTRKNRERYKIHDPIGVTFCTFERDGRFLLQIDSYGRKSRQVPGKQSQTLQFERKAAHKLYKILGETFHFG